MNRRIEISATDGGRFEGYFVLPAKLPAPGLVILPEVFNVNDHIRSVADEYAADGFIVIAPDLYWRQQPGTYLPYTDAGVAQAKELWGQLDTEEFAQDLRDVIATLRDQPGCTGKIGVLGFCLGGTFSFLSCARHDINAAVSYYGVKIEEHLDEANHLTCPILMHFAENDPHVPHEAVASICEHTKVSGRARVHVYEGATHGFNRRGYPPYHAQASLAARERTLAHLRRHLLSSPGSK